MNNYEKYIQVVEEIKTIPHLDLLKQYDVSKLTDELNQIKEFKSYETKYKTSQNLYNKAWSGASLYGTDGDPYKNFTENSASKNMSITSVGKMCPYMMSIMDDIGTENTLARIMRISPNSQLNWHSHNLQHKQPDHILTIQVPIYVPKNFKYVVRGLKDNKIYEKIYQAGRVYIFNSFHYHNVFNESNEYRVTIMVYMNLKKEKCLNLVHNAILNYKGPRVS